MKVAIYSRKSRDNGNGKEETLFNQSSSLKSYAEKKGYTYDLFEEVESSLNERPELTKVQLGIEQGLYNRIIIVHVDRLGRNISILSTIAKLCLTHNVMIETPETVYDMKDPSTKMMFGFQSVIAEAEMDNIRDRLAKGKYNTVAERGRHLVSVAPLGYSYDKNDKKLHVNPDQAPIVRKIVELALSGYSTRIIAEKVNQLGYKTAQGSFFKGDSIQRILKRRTYLGEGFYNSKRLGKSATAKDCHEPLITEEDFNTIQTLLKSRICKQNTKSLGIKSPLNKLLVCGKCGGGLTIQKNNKVSKDKQKDLSFYQVRPCHHHINEYTHCDNGGIKIGKLEKIVFEAIKDKKDSIKKELQRLLKNDVSGTKSRMESNLLNIKKELLNQDNQLDKLLNLYLKEKVSEEVYDTKSATIKEVKENLKSEIELLEYQLEKLDVSSQLTKVDKVIHLIDNFHEMAIEDQQATLRLLIEKVVLTKPKGQLKSSDTKVEIHFREL
ncbi:recombinase family protein [Peribacillus psychrosaccharolyticus]|uniref:Recombinase family protein n=1 Tax=Peribacillus psychrosaccharolyticus TaxID=1407 RepID=A0A974NLA0_PERPY|nr:recombinase family protein [Peribacillus psychrosaccharolyticus]MEC2054261.1 recombinase family protein [Peribacillus psychrosaccharolyticus]MED3744511.1 recombinase family protein [Peribacillus psychrosaccharolyticus]QQS99975.1 recombinase family protein [Peribacillus psychrosaccharolyticus]